MKKIDNTLMRTLALIDLRIPFVINPVLQQINRKEASLMSMKDFDIQMAQVKAITHFAQCNLHNFDP